MKLCTRNRLKIAKGEEGQALVELALVLPLLLLLFLGIMEGGRIMSAYVEMQSATRDSCRFAAINCTSLMVSEADVASWVADVLTPWAGSRLNSLNSERLNLAFQRTVVEEEGEVWVQVTLRYPLEIVTPIIGDITGNPFNLESRVVMRGE